VGRFWTGEEILYLKNNYNLLSARRLADALNRTIGAINLKALKLGLTKDIRGNLGLYYNPVTLSEIIGISPHLIRKYTKLGYLKSDTIDCTVRSAKFNYYRYTPNQVVEFLANYPDLWGKGKICADDINLLLLDYTGKDKKSYVAKIRNTIQYKN